MVRSSAGPIALHIRLGWLLSGPTGIPEEQVTLANIVISHTLRIDSELEVGERLDAMLSKFWEVETLGVQNKDALVLEDFDDHIVFKDNRY